MKQQQTSWKRRLGIQGSTCLRNGGNGALNHLEHLLWTERLYPQISPVGTSVWRYLKMAVLERYLGPKGRTSWWNPCIYNKNQLLPRLCVAVKKAATGTLDLPQVPHHTLPACLWWFTTARARNLGVFPSARAQLRAVYISRSYQDTASASWAHSFSMTSQLPAPVAMSSPPWCIHKTFLYCFCQSISSRPQKSHLALGFLITEADTILNVPKCHLYNNYPV